jgi:hypothetical protein
LESEVLIMAEMNELHFETIDRNKDINLQRNKLKFLEDRIATLEKTLESHAKILARFQMTEGINHE